MIAAVAMQAAAALLCWWRGARWLAGGLGAIFALSLASLVVRGWPWDSIPQALAPLACAAGVVLEARRR
jgi:hypothetical protein